MRPLSRLLSLAALLALVTLCLACGGGGRPASPKSTEKESEAPPAEVEPAKPAEPEAPPPDAPPKEEAKPKVEKPARKLVAIKSFDAVDAWYRADELKGRRVRLTGEATVKRSRNGVYLVFAKASGLRVATVSVKNDDAEPVAGVKVGETARRKVNLETTVKGVTSGQLILEDGELLALNAPEGFVEVEETTTVRAAPGEGSGGGGGTGGGGGRGGTGGGAVGATAGGKTVNVRAYQRKDGTIVRAHMRAAPGRGGRR
jgi:hypothetical protein